MKQVEKYAKYQPYLDFIERYKNADNAADGSERDANANVENKNITTMEGELFKGDFIGVNRLAMWQKIKELYDEGLAEEYLRQLEEHEIYRHDETALKPYCVSITMYPFLFGGITSIGGLSDAPTNIHSYTGGVVNLVFAIASQFAGAVSTPEFLPYFDYFLRKEYGDDYYLRADEVVDLSLKKRTIRKVVEDLFQQAVYSLNQPAAARNFQCVREDTTQLWTPQGFKYLSELKEGDTCFVWKDGKISEQPIKHLNVYDYDGEMIQFKGEDGYQQTVTPNHRVVYKSDETDGWTIKEAKDIEHHLNKVSMPIAGQLEREGVDISDNMLRLCVYTLMHGFTRGARVKSPALDFIMVSNTSLLNEIKTALQKEKLVYTEKEHFIHLLGSSLTSITLSKKSSADILSLLNNTKEQIPEWFSQLSPRQAQIVLDCWSKTGAEHLLSCRNKEDADALQQVCMIAGLGSSIVYRGGTPYVQTFNCSSKKVGASSRITYKGRVWCPTTDAGIVIFREENKTPYVSGNSVFWNIAYYDEPYFKGLFQDFVFPDGSPMIWESTSWLQETFMNWFNEERKKKILTFPVESISLLHNGKEFMDPYWKEKTAEMWAKGHSFFCYTSDSVDSLSSCCFSPDTKVLAKSSSGVFFGPIGDLHNMKYTGNKENLCVYHNGSWASAKTIKLPARPMYSIKTANGKTVCATDNHLFPTLRGDVSAESLTTDDYLLFNTLALDAVPEKDEKLSYNQGFLIGMYLGDGSIDTHGPCQKSVMFSLNEEKLQSCISCMNEALSEIAHGEKFSVYKIVNNVVPVNYYGDILADFIQRFVSGRYANEKHLLPETFLQSQLFRKGILDGFYATDGGNSNRIYTTSQKLSEDIECLCATLGLNTSVSVTDRTDEPVIIRGETYSRNFPLYCIRWYSPKNKRSMKGIFRIVNNGMYFRVTDIRPVEDYPHDSVYCFEMDDQDEPYFTLPNGMITHNCRLRNEMQENTFSFTLGAGGVSTGSKCVMTMNVNRLVQNAIRDNIPIEEAVAAQTEKLHKYLLAFNEILKENLVKHMLPIYEAGFISLDKQYLTIGINGFVEGAEFLGIEIAPDNPEYISYGEKILKPIYLLNKRDKDPQNGIMFNTEFVPAENLGVKFAKWDKRDGYFVPRDCYNSYFYLVEDETKNVLDKFKMSGKQFTQYLDGGSAYHCNLSEHLSKDQYLKMLDAAMVTGCPYFTFNIPNTICNDCGHIDKHCLNECPACGSKNLDYATRVIGYLKRVSCFSKARREEAKKRAYIHG